MSSYRFIKASLTVSSSGAMASTNTITSAAIDVTSLKACAFMITWTGTPNGAFVIQGSLDNVTFATITDISIDPAVGAAGSRAVDIGLTAFPFLRVSYTNTSSTGTLTVTAAAKT